MKNLKITEFIRQGNKRIINTIIALIIIIALLIFAARCTIVEQGKEEIQTEYFEFDDYARKIHHVNDRKGYTASLN